MLKLDLTLQDLFKFQQCFISEDTVKEAGIFRVASDSGAEIVGRKNDRDYSGLVFTYYIPGDTNPRDYRLRRDNPDLEEKENRSFKEKDKYLSAPGRGNHIYFPPCILKEWLNDATLPIVLTEGEKKTLALWELARFVLESDSSLPRFLPIGIPGVWNWRGRIGKTNNTEGKRVDVKGAIPDFDLIEWKDRKVIICFDANVATKASVENARVKLSKELVKRGANVYWINLPEIEGVNGIDDLLGLKGAEYGLALIDSAIPFEDESKKTRKPQSLILVELASDIELFHTNDGKAYATIPINHHSETYPLKSSNFRDWLSREFYERECKTPSAQALQDAINTLSGKARFDGEEQEVHLRVAEKDGEIWLDLCDEAWTVVRIDRDGWRIESSTRIKFRRTKGMKALPHPAHGGSLNQLRALLNMTDKDYALFLTWLVSALRPSRPSPILIVSGEQGSAKSTVSKVGKELIDPNIAPLRSLQKDEKDLMITANNSRVIALDNLSSINNTTSDALCRLSTGGGFSSRTLFENEEETIFQAMRPIILNGIEDLATRSDLIDRAVILDLPRIPDTKRRLESEIWKEFEEIRPVVLGALLDAVSQALRHVDKIKLDKLPRMADYTLWSCAAETALGLKEGVFLKAYLENRDGSNNMALEASPIAPLVIELVKDKKEWQGTAKDLLEELNKLADDQTQKLKGFPKQPNILSGQLRLIAPNLRMSDIELTFFKKNGSRRITLEYKQNSSSESSESSDKVESEDISSVQQDDCMSKRNGLDDNKQGSYRLADDTSTNLRSIYSAINAEENEGYDSSNAIRTIEDDETSDYSEEELEVI